MSKMGDHFRRGKLQVALSIVEELGRVYGGSELGVRFRTAYRALSRADAELVLAVRGKMGRGLVREGEVGSKGSIGG